MAEQDDEEEDYKLLSIFEMLWNVFKPGATSPSSQEKKKDKKSKEEKSSATGGDKMLGHAMTIKDEYLAQGDEGFLSLLAICEQVRKPATFLCETVTTSKSKEMQFPL